MATYAPQEPHIGRSERHSAAFPTLKGKETAPGIIQAPYLLPPQAGIARRLHLRCLDSFQQLTHKFALLPRGRASWGLLHCGRLRNRNTEYGMAIFSLGLLMGYDNDSFIIQP